MLTRLRNNGLSLVLVALFLCCWAGQFFAGFHVRNEDRQQHGQPPESARAYFTDGHFWQATGENWESEFLEMTTFVVLTTCLVQKGSPESRDPDDANNPVDEDPRKHRNDPNAPWPVRRGGAVLWIYERSLSICFISLFVLSLSLHVTGGRCAYNEQQAEHGEQPVSIAGFVATSEFWFQLCQNWQSEFLSIASMVFLSVYLRQRGSAESKPVATPHDEHGA